MSHDTEHRQASRSGPIPVARRRVAVGDVLVRRDDGGYGIFNYRGERVLDARLESSTEAARVAADIVSPWQGRVQVVDDSGVGGS